MSSSAFNAQNIIFDKLDLSPLFTDVSSILSGSGGKIMLTLKGRSSGASLSPLDRRFVVKTAPTTLCECGNNECFTVMESSPSNTANKASKLGTTSDPSSDLRSFIIRMGGTETGFDSNLSDAIDYYDSFLTTRLVDVDNQDILEVILKAMLWALQLNDCDLKFIALMKNFKDKLSIPSYKYSSSSLLKLMKLTALALFKPEVSLSTFCRLIVPFIEHLIGFEGKTLEDSFNLVLAVGFKEKSKSTEDGGCQINFKYHHIIEIIEIKFIPDIGYFSSKPISDGIPYSFLSTFINHLYEMNERTKLDTFMSSFELNYQHNLSLHDSTSILIPASQLKDLSTFRIILSKSSANFSFLLSVPTISKYISSHIRLMDMIPPITELSLNPDNFPLQLEQAKYLLKIFLRKSSIECIFYHLISSKTYDLFEAFLIALDSNVSVNYSAISDSLVGSIYGMDFLHYLILKTVEYKLIPQFVFKLLRKSMFSLEINQLILDVLSELPIFQYTSSIIKKLVSMSTSFDDLFSLAFREKAATPLFILSSFYRVESTKELLEDVVAAQRSIEIGTFSIHVRTELGRTIELFL